MKIPIGLQLYSLREQLAFKFEETFKTISNAGFMGIELAGLHNQTPRKWKQLLNRFELYAIAMHCDVLTPEGLKRSLEAADILDCEHLVCPWCPPETFRDEKSIRLLAEELNNANELITAQGRSLHYHNHNFEFNLIKGQYGLDILIANLVQSVNIELDTYWVSVHGEDHLALINSLDKRIKMMHVKDGLISPPFPNTAIGDGLMNYQQIIASLPSSVNWLFIEIEECKTGIPEALNRSVKYLQDLNTEQYKK